jgi:hypothetical protein
MSSSATAPAAVVTSTSLTNSTAKSFNANDQKGKRHRHNERRLSPDQVCKLVAKDRYFAVAYARMCHNAICALAKAGFPNDSKEIVAMERELKRAEALKRTLNQAMLYAIAMKDITVTFVVRRLHKYAQLTEHQLRIRDQLANLYAIEFDQFKCKMADLSEQYDDLNRFKGRPMYNPNVASKYPPLLDFVEASQLTLLKFEANEHRVAGSNYKYLSNVFRYTHTNLRSAVSAHNYHCRHISETYGEEAVRKWFHGLSSETFSRLDRVHKTVSEVALVAGSKLMKRCIGREIAAQKRIARNS